MKKPQKRQRFKILGKKEGISWKISLKNYVEAVQSITWKMSKRGGKYWENIVRIANTHLTGISKQQDGKTEVKCPRIWNILNSCKYYKEFQDIKN